MAGLDPAVPVAGAAPLGSGLTGTRPAMTRRLNSHPTGASAAMTIVTWGGAGACGRWNASTGLGRPRPIRGPSRIWDHPRLIRPPRTRTGIVPRRSVNVRKNNGMVDI